MVKQSSPSLLLLLLLLSSQCVAQTQDTKEPSVSERTDAEDICTVMQKIRELQDTVVNLKSQLEEQRKTGDTYAEENVLCAGHYGKESLNNANKP